MTNENNLNTLCDVVEVSSEMWGYFSEQKPPFDAHATSWTSNPGTKYWSCLFISQGPPTVFKCRKCVESQLIQLKGLMNMISC